MKTLKEAVLEAESNKKAIGHFNISNLEAFRSIVEGALELSIEVGEKIPVIIGVSEGERDFVGVKRAKDLVLSARAEYDHPIFINADHTYSFERVKEVIDAGYDSVIIDGAGLPLNENIALAKNTVEYAKSSNPNIIVEAELGYIGTSSKMLDEIPEGVLMSDEFLTDPNEAKSFVDTTGVDMLAPAVGNLHGMLKHAKNPNLDIERIRSIREISGVPLVLHGGSGISDDDFKEAIKAGISIVHINTEIRVAYRDVMAKMFNENPDEVAPYKIAKPAVEAMKEVVKDRIRLFSLYQ